MHPFFFIFKFDCIVHASLHMTFFMYLNTQKIHFFKSKLRVMFFLKILIFSNYIILYSVKKCWKTNVTWVFNLNTKFLVLNAHNVGIALLALLAYSQCFIV